MMIAHVEIFESHLPDDPDTIVEESQELFCTVESVVLARQKTIYYLGQAKIASPYWLDTSNLSLHRQGNDYQLRYDCIRREYEDDTVYSIV
jgi:hypothetical protein